MPVGSMPGYKATLKPNASPIYELEEGAQDVRKRVGFGIESNFNSLFFQCI
jgi:hypothetical protein